ncbi:MAG: peptidylprolyl isomerase [Rhodobacterales bacterium 32-66-7]|nr:MAG: peptidylprolyl isomerase [Rhodobacterales bacterium 12-65-15]OYX27506.1 MAG: peptidylprolyl isomerase [Rhodobacterales bacterium 32-66-7]
MAETPSDDKKRPKSLAREVAVWVLMAMLIVGLGGFGVTSFSGGVATVGRVGDIEISADDYAIALQNRVAALSEQLGVQIPTREALAFGVEGQVLENLVQRAALDNEAGRIGLSVGDATVAAELRGMDAFMGVSGTFDREAYRFALERSRQTEVEFEARLRGDIARQLLQGVVAGGFTAPATLTDTLYAWAAEKRGFTMLRLTEADLTRPVPIPTDAELQAYHHTNIAAFTRPEAKRITYAALLPDAIAADQPVDDTVLKQLYEDRITEFVVPERRLVERLVYPDQAAADAARAELDAGKPFDTLVMERGLTLDAIDLGDVSRDDLGDVGEAVFSLPEGGVAGPLATDLGPALFRVAAVLAAEETSFDDAKAGLALELQLEAARGLIDGQVDLVDDLLASGATLEDLVAEAGMTLGTVDHVVGQRGDTAIEGYAAFLDAADAVAEGDFSEAILLEDGGLVALRLDEIVPATPIPFDEARDAVTQAWQAEALSQALATRAAEIKAQIEGEGGPAIGSFGIVDVTPAITRDGTVEGAPGNLMTEVFGMAEGEVRVVEAKGFIAVVRLDRILPAATEGDDAEALQAALVSQAQQAIAADAFAAFAAALTNEAGISLDQATINAVNASLP